MDETLIALSGRMVGAVEALVLRGTRTFLSMKYQWCGVAGWSAQHSYWCYVGCWVSYH